MLLLTRSMENERLGWLLESQDGDVGHEDVLIIEGKNEEGVV